MDESTGINENDRFIFGFDSRDVEISCPLKAHKSDDFRSVTE
jgi:hypothetical protein